ncbi:hypothetical protein [Massilibacteroides sp.]|uniref:hypothetical protein n=1 Tax=Massilibacteroides sp. TaxID=2034766 RepID=UPI00260D63AF|nr:hypothetical protein [Massilibacteroides sp.]MDD4514719.1 hypothetical protein [Massilibacteroides sp.]
MSKRHRQNPVIRHEIYDIGLPAAYSRENAEVTFLSNENVYIISDEEMNISSSGVDGEYKIFNIQQIGAWEMVLAITN